MLAFTIAGIGADEADIHAVLNMSDAILDVELPMLPSRRWHLAVNTAAAAPEDLIEREHQAPLRDSVYRVPTRSVVVFEAPRTDS